MTLPTGTGARTANSTITIEASFQRPTDNYPKSFDLSNTVSMTLRTLGESIRAAQQNYLPNYIVAVITTEVDGKKVYHFDDGCALLAYVNASVMQNQPVLNPLNMQPIVDIDLFRVRCWSVDPLGKVNSLDHGWVFHHVNYKDNNKYSAEAFGALLTACNASLAETDDIKAKKLQRRAILILSKMVNEGTLFPELGDLMRNGEVCIWEHCANTGNHILLDELQHLPTARELFPELSFNGEDSPATDGYVSEEETSLPTANSGHISGSDS